LDLKDDTEEEGEEEGKEEGEEDGDGMTVEEQDAIVTFSHSKQFISPPRINSPFTYTLTQEQ